MIILDTETTGLLKPSSVSYNRQPKIIEAGIIKATKKGKIIEEYSQLINPEEEITKEIYHITGIKNKELNKAPIFLEVWENIANLFLGEKDIVGHNVLFDVEILHYALKRIDKDKFFPYCMNRICTVEKTYHIKNRRLKLDELYFMATGQKPKNHHRALDDARSTLDIYKWLRKKDIIK